MAAKEWLKCEVARKDPASEGYTFQKYHVPYLEGMTILDVLRYIADELDGSFSFYDHSCKRGFCGSCLIKINGKQGLACRVLAPRDFVRLEPQRKCAKDFWPLDEEDDG